MPYFNLLGATGALGTWAKLVRGPDGAVETWHSLVGHCADVAACFEAILSMPTPAGRLAALAGREALGEIWIHRLCVIAALHDFGKANSGFQARWNVDAPLVGHCREALVAMADPTLRDALAGALPLGDILSWGAPAEGLLVALAHHGRPLDPEARDEEALRRWRKTRDYDPIAALRPLGEAVRLWFPAAFIAGGEALPETPAFWHAVLGYLILADWLGSDATFFPHGNGTDRNRMTAARTTARLALAAIGFDPAASRAALTRPSFYDVSPHAARPIQSAAGEMIGNLAILESDTGSGKTEAALWRFARLFARGEIDGLYFALPTRVAAVSLHKRVCEAMARLFPNEAARPSVTLAVPGMSRDAAQGGTGLRSAAPDVTERPQEATAAPHWAAERPKRFLAGTIAVGTIDQALLGAVAVKHAHLRAGCLLRNLLVVDEVHASDTYMGGLLEHLLSFHVSAGGHALLLSATLGSAARTRYLRGTSAMPPSFAAAVSTSYPALWTSEGSEPVAPESVGRRRTIAMALAADGGDPLAVAARALAVARAGAKALVVRNLRRDAIAVFHAIVELGGAELLFSCRGVPTLHHGRFAREDRMLLDDAIVTALGKTRPEGGLIAIGTQTLEQSLDIDADFLVTDLCPADVLLQRIGRLHRHERSRPPGYETPRALVLSPDDLMPLIARGAHGLGFFSSGGARIPYPYPDLVGLEATRRLIEDNPSWRIPQMNRLLVETVTHPERREALIETLRPQKDWREAANAIEGRGRSLVFQARQARLRTDLSFTNPEVVFPEGETCGSRLGARDLLVEFNPTVMGPFGERVSQVAIPDYWAHGIDPAKDTAPRVEAAADALLAFSIQGVGFGYDALGLRRAR